MNMKQSVDLINLMMSNPDNFSNLWVFAYGSLLWKPCFQYHRQVVGNIRGFKRRFFQGNTNLRGSPSHPGRVAILVPDKEEVTWGVAYEIRGSEHVLAALEHLYVRENANGGYHSMLTTFYPRQTASPSATSAATSAKSRSSNNHTSDGESDVESDSESYQPDVTESYQSDVTDSDDDVDITMTSQQPFPILAFTATSASDQWLGEEEIDVMARQVAAANGEAGPNSEYVLRTAEYVREHIPEDHDKHLFDLERGVLEVLSHPKPTTTLTVGANVTVSTGVVTDSQQLVMHHHHQHQHYHLERDLAQHTPVPVRV